MKKFITIFLVSLVMMTSVFALSLTTDEVTLDDFTFTADVGFGKIDSVSGCTGTVGARWAIAEGSIDFDGYSLPSTIDVVASIGCTSNFKSYAVPEFTFGAGFTADITNEVFTTFDVDFVMDGIITQNTDFALGLGFGIGIGFGYQITDMIGVYVRGEFTDLYTTTSNSICWNTKAGAAFNF